MNAGLPMPLRPRAAYRRGSVLIFVVCLLVLITMMGLMYIQVARLDKFATRTMGHRYIDQVATATTSRIQNTLKAGVFSDTAQLTPVTPLTNPPTYTPPIAFHLDSYAAPAVAGGFAGSLDDYHELFAPLTNLPYDYPSSGGYTVDSGGAIGASVLGHADKMWLASNQFFTIGGQTIWFHLTNLTRSWLDHGGTTVDRTGYLNIHDSAISYYPTESSQASTLR